MGLYDREYYRDDNFGGIYPPRRQKSAVFILIFLNVAIWLVNAFLFSTPGETGMPQESLTGWMALRPTDIWEPWEWYRFLTYGFAHADTANHVLFNMLTLFFLGPMVEMRYGRREFLWFYLTAIVIGGVFWASTTYYSLASQYELSHEAFQHLAQQHMVPQLVGASGAVTAIVILFAFNFPHEKLLLFFFIPAPAWVLGLLIVGLDLWGSMEQGTNIAHSVHLAGAAFAFLYYITRFSFTGIFGGRTFYHPTIGNLGEPAHTRYREPEDYDDPPSYGTPPPLYRPEERQKEEEEFRALEEEVERLLRKISQSGMQSLTPEEVRRLQEASKIYRSRR